MVSIGFGSMTSHDPRATTELVLGAVRDAGVRAVLLSGWGGLAALEGSADVFRCESLPHDWLFARVDAVVHHGGAGTTGAGIASGRPALVTPFAMDQFFWAGRVAALGVGPQPIPRRRLTREGLAGALRGMIGDREMQERAAVLGRLVREEDGVAAAVAVFERLVSSQMATGNRLRRM